MRINELSSCYIKVICLSIILKRNNCHTRGELPCHSRTCQHMHLVISDFSEGMKKVLCLTSNSWLVSCLSISCFQTVNAYYVY